MLFYNHGDTQGQVEMFFPDDVAATSEIFPLRFQIINSYTCLITWVNHYSWQRRHVGPLAYRIDFLTEIKSHYSSVFQYKVCRLYIHANMQQSIQYPDAQQRMNRLKREWWQQNCSGFPQQTRDWGISRSGNRDDHCFMTFNTHSSTTQLSPPHILPTWVCPAQGQRGYPPPGGGTRGIHWLMSILCMLREILFGDCLD